MNLAILGASGHGKVIADAALAAGWSSVTFFDDAYPSKTACSRWLIAGNSEDLAKRHAEFSGVIVGIGINRTRWEKHTQLSELRANIVSIIHPCATISPFAILGVGSLVLAGAVVNVDACIGEASIINSGAVVEHDCQLGNAVHIGPKAAIGGGADIGNQTWVGIGATVRHSIKISSEVIVGAGAAVVANILSPCTVVGIPAKPIQENQC